MTSAPQPGPACVLCSTPLAAGVERCPVCGYVPTAVASQQLVARRSLWILVGILVGVYVVALAIVAAAR